jgi:hypothetical protein
MEHNLEFLVPLGFFALVVLIVKIISDNKLRHKLISQNMVDDRVKYLFLKPTAEITLSSIKWGMILIGIGLAMFIRSLFPYYVSEEMTLGLIFLFSGLALIISFGLEKAHAQKNKPE